MTTVILAYLFYFVASSASPLQLRWLKTKYAEGGEIALAFWVMLMLGILGFSLVLVSPLTLAGNPLVLTALTIACGIFGAAYFIGSYVAQKYVEAGVSTIALNIYTPMTIVLSTLFLDESLKPIQILGTILLLVALFLISKKHRIGRFKFDKYFVMMLASGIAMGLLLVAERALQKTTGFSGGTLLSWWAQCITLGIAMLIFRSKNTYGIKDTFVTGIVRFLGAFSWVFLVYIVGNLSVVSSITTFKVVIIFIAAALFLKEREDLPRKIIGSLIAVAGLLLMR